MVRAVLWKEWREQAAIIVALLALGGGVIAAAVQFGGPISDAGPLEFRGYGEAGRLAFLLLALTAGTVIGGALFAGEDEAGTTGYLASLPASRWRLWRGKVAAGLVLAAAAGAALIAEGAALGALGPRRVAAGWGAWSAVLILAAFGWGAFGSVLARNTLAACGIGAVSAPIAGGFFLAATNIALTVAGYRAGPSYGALELALQATAFFLVFAPVGLSGVIYSAPDRARRDYELTPGTVGTTRAAAREVGRRRSGLGVRALVWLSFRQYLVPVIVLTGLAAAFGSAMLIDAAPLLVGWPAATLALGVLVGVIGWADEQGRGAARYWGERRLPVGRLWLAKVAAGLGVTLGLSVVYLLPSTIRAAVAGESHGPYVHAVFRSGLLASDVLYGSGRTDPSNFLYFVFLWPVYGFAFGHLAGMLFRKAIVAAGVGLLTAGAFAGLWLPSFFGGGLHHWQLWPVPVLAVLTARLIARAWAADRVGTRRPVAVLVTSVALAVGLTAAGLGYRVAEVPVIPQADDDLKFAATIPGYEQNEAGREIRAAIGRYQSIGQVDWQRMNQGGAPLFPNDPEAAGMWGFGGRPQSQSYRQQMYLVPRHGWPADRPDADAWLDGLFTSDWDKPLYVAATKPLGVIEDPTAQYVNSPLAAFDVLQEMPLVLLARGLQGQARGDPAAYVRCLDAALALARNARHKSTAWYAQAGRRVETQALESLDRWLERLAGRPDLLRQALGVLARHEAAVPTDPTATWLAGRTVVRNTVTAPSGWAEKQLREVIGSLGPRADADAVKARAEVEASLLGFAWAVPWEKERLRRVVGLGNDPKRTLEVAELTRGAPTQFEVFTPDTTWNEPEYAAGRRAAVLKAAVRLYEAEADQPPDRLDRLVPKYLPAVPADPFDGKPFRYRRSAGEQVKMELLQPAYGGVPGVPALPPTGPGYGDGLELTDGMFDALAAGMGGFVRFPVPPRELSDDQYDAVAAAAGGVVQWPLPPLTPEAAEAGRAFPEGAAPGGFGGAGGPGGPTGFGGDPGLSLRRANPFARPFESRRVVDVAPGQGVLWSVGYDQTDDGGTDLAGRVGNRNAVSFGDLIYVVPLPAGKKPAPPTK